MFSEKILVKYFEILKFIEAGFELIEKDNVVYVRKGKRKIAVLDLGCPEAQFVWKMLKKEVSVDEVADMIEATKRNYKKRKEKKERRETTKRSYETGKIFAEKQLESYGICIFDRVAEVLLQLGADKYRAFDLAREILAELQAEYGEKAVAVGEPPKALVLKKELSRPWASGAKEVYVSSYCYNPPFNPRGYTYTPVKKEPIKIRVFRSGSSIIGRVVWHPRNRYLNRRVYFAHCVPLPEPGKIYWTYLYKLGKTGVIWVYGYSKTSTEAAAMRELKLRELEEAGHFVPGAVYGVDKYFKVYKVVGAKYRVGGVYIAEKGGSKRVVRAKETKPAPDLTPLLSSFDRVVERRAEPTVDILAYKAVAGGFNYLASIKLASLIHIHTLHNIFAEAFGAKAPPQYFVTLISDYNIAVKRLHNFSYRGFTDLAYKLIQHVLVDSVVIRCSKVSAWSRRERRNKIIYQINIVFKVAGRNFGDAVRAVNEINRVVFSEKYTLREDLYVAPGSDT